MELDKIYNMDAFDGMKQIPDNIYPVDDYSPGTNAPPLHPHCRSTIVGSLKGDNRGG